MDLSFQAVELSLRDPFTIARGTQHVAQTVHVRLTDGKTEGVGEAAPSDHYGELQSTVLAFLHHFRSVADNHQSLSLQSLHSLMDQTARLNPAAKAAVDMATYDLLGKRCGVPIYELLGVDPGRTPVTSYTIGIDTPEIMGQRAAQAARYPVLKVKVGTERDIENLQAIRDARPDAILRVDANEAWTPKEAVARIENLAEFDLEFVEQPVDGANLEGLGYVQSAISLPVIADESCVTPADVARVAPFVDGINIKLMKCGGLYPALQMIHLARGLGLRIMLGCMIESSVAITAAAHLSPLVDYADLDGNLLITSDPYRGVTVQDGKLILPTAPGLGLQPAP